MRRLPVIVAAAIGLLFPLGLAFAVYLASASSLEESANAAFPTSQTIAQPTVTVEPRTKRPKPAATTTGREDARGRCDEPEHRSDPDCALNTGTNAETGDNDSSRGRGSDDSGSGSGSGSGSNSGSGGSGSGGSGSEDSGSDDSSGKGSGGDDD